MGYFYGESTKYPGRAPRRGGLGGVLARRQDAGERVQGHNDQALGRDDGQVTSHAYRPHGPNRVAGLLARWQDPGDRRRRGRHVRETVGPDKAIATQPKPLY